MALSPLYHRFITALTQLYHRFNTALSPLYRWSLALPGPPSLHSKPSLQTFPSNFEVLRGRHEVQEGRLEFQRGRLEFQGAIITVCRIIQAFIFSVH